MWKTQSITFISAQLSKNQTSPFWTATSNQCQDFCKSNWNNFCQDQTLICQQPLYFSNTYQLNLFNANPRVEWSCLKAYSNVSWHNYIVSHQRWANNSVFEYYSNTWGRILVFVFVFGWFFETEYYSYSYSGDFLKPNIIRIRIRVIFSNFF